MSKSNLSRSATAKYIFLLLTDRMKPVLRKFYVKFNNRYCTPISQKLLMLLRYHTESSWHDTLRYDISLGGSQWQCFVVWYMFVCHTFIGFLVHLSLYRVHASVPLDIHVEMRPRDLHLFLNVHMLASSLCALIAYILIVDTYCKATFFCSSFIYANYASQAPVA